MKWGSSFVLAFPRDLAPHGTDRPVGPGPIPLVWNGQSQLLGPWNRSPFQEVLTGDPGEWQEFKKGVHSGL